jgi:hypothetical protein
MRRLLVALLFALLPFARAEPFSRDLGQGLAYHRIHQLPADLPTAETARRQPCVLDLRYVHAPAPEAAALEAWVKFRATARTPIFILANSDTDTALLAPFTPRQATAGVVVIGAAAPGFAPDIAVKFSRDEERRAYDAIESGVEIATLLNDSPPKPRNDEARLAREHSPDAPPVDEEAALAEKLAQPGTRAPIIDLVLQRAVQLHRTLVALKQL